MSAVQAVSATKFLRRTTLRGTEANSNFKMLDDDVAEAITSADADAVTPLMSKVYTRLLLTPPEMREGERVLRFAGQERGGKWVTAWEQLRGHLRVSGETASKALRWMHSQGIIGYFAGRNGVGIRIFLNRAANSVVTRREARPQKILSFGHASDDAGRTSPGAMPFKDSYAVSEVLEKDLNPRAPKNGAGRLPAVGSTSDLPACSPRQYAMAQPAMTSQPTHASVQRSTASLPSEQSAAWMAAHATLPLDEIVKRLKFELEPALRNLARQAAALEHEQTREWLESRGLPKAARVAQRETYNVLRSQGIVARGSRDTHAGAGRDERDPAAPRAITESEACELAEACLSLFEAKGQAVEVTLSEMSAAAGGFLLPEDAARVLEKIDKLLGRSAGGEGKGRVP